MSDVVLTLANLHKSFGEEKVINALDLNINRGEAFTLLGPSGCGKSTTLRIIAGLEDPDDGEISFQDKTWVSAKNNIFVPPHKRNIGVVFQNYAIWPHMTVFQNVAYPLQVRGNKKKKEIKERVVHALQQVGLDHLIDRPAPMLSGGQQQRVSIARALVYEPDILLLDEPFSNLDAKLREHMRLEVKSLQKRLNLTIILVTHDHMDAFTISDRIGIMNHGKIEQIDSSFNMYVNPKTPFIRDFVGKTVMLKGAVEKKGDGKHWVKLGGNNQLPLNLSGDLAEYENAGSISLSVRPEDINISGDDITSLKEHEVVGHVEHVLFVGDRYECRINLSDDNKIVSYLNKKSRPPKENEMVKVSIDLSEIKVWGG